MKLPRKTRSRKPFIITGAIIAAILIAAGAYILIAKPGQQSSQDVPNQPAPPNTVNYDAATEEEKQDSTNAKKELEEQSNPAPSGNLGISITRAGQAQGSQEVNIRSIVNGASSGSCTATFSKSGQPNLVRTFQITAEATTSVCNGNITVGDFTASGDWQLTLVANSGNNSATATQTVGITK